MSTQASAIVSTGDAVNPGEIVCLVGESGSGKTTTALTAFGYCAPNLKISEGRIVVGDQDVKYTSLDTIRGREIAYVPLNPGGALNPSLRVVDAVAAHPGGACDVTQKMPVPNPPAAADEPYRKVAVSISLRCDVQPLAETLHDLEQGTPYLFVDDLSIYRNPVAALQQNIAPLEVQFTLSGYVRQPRTAGGEASQEAP